MEKRALKFSLLVARSIAGLGGVALNFFFRRGRGFMGWIFHDGLG